MILWSIHKAFVICSRIKRALINDIICLWIIRVSSMINSWSVRETIMGSDCIKFFVYQTLLVNAFISLRASERRLRDEFAIRSLWKSIIKSYSSQTTLHRANTIPDQSSGDSGQRKTGIKFSSKRSRLTPIHLSDPLLASTSSELHCCRDINRTISLPGCKFHDGEIPTILEEETRQKEEGVGVCWRKKDFR